MSREEDLKLLDASDEARKCPIHFAYDGKTNPPDSGCIGCWNIYIWQLALEQCND